MKHFKLLLLLLFVGSSGILFFSCNDEEEPPNPVLGIWSLDKIEWSNISPDSLSGFEGQFVPSFFGISKQELVFNDDNTFEFERRSSAIISTGEGNWELNDDEIDIEFDTGEEFTLELSDDMEEIAWETINGGPISFGFGNEQITFTNLLEMEFYVKEIQ